jgi:hypothetical protein
MCIVVKKELVMSAMSNLAVEIDGMLVEGYLPVTIARLLDVPINWVYEVADPSEDSVNQENEDCSPFATVNS